MEIYLHVALPGAPLFRQKAKLHVPDGTVVEDALSLYAQKFGAMGLFARKDGLSILVNGTRGMLSQPLRARDRVKVFRPVRIG